MLGTPSHGLIQKPRASHPPTIPSSSRSALAGVGDKGWTIGPSAEMRGIWQSEMSVGFRSEIRGLPAV